MTDPFTAALVGACIALVGSNVTRLNRLENRVAKLSRIEAKLDALLAHSGIEYDPCEGVEDQIIEALKAGNKIEAIKCYRESSGESLKAAKEHIEEIQRRGNFTG
jgi:ribosomal protein L7/L12